MSGTLLNRTIQITSNTTLSTTAKTSTGVLQGGTLAPLQFTYYINQVIHQTIPGIHSIYAFADDIAFLCVSNTQYQLEKLANRALTTLLHRLEALHCEISYNKTKLITFNCKIPYLTYRNNKIHHVRQHKILGVTIDKTLTFHSHVNTIIKKMKTTLTWLKDIAKTFHIQKHRTLTIQYVLSILDYSILTIYSFLSKTNKAKLNTIISTAAKFILQCPNSTPTDFSILEANLQKLKTELSI
jgi:hypothetical protein